MLEELFREDFASSQQLLECHTWRPADSFQPEPDDTFFYVQSRLTHLCLLIDESTPVMSGAVCQTDLKYVYQQFLFDFVPFSFCVQGMIILGPRLDPNFFAKKTHVCFARFWNVAIVLYLYNYIKYVVKWCPFSNQVKVSIANLLIGIFKINDHYFSWKSTCFWALYFIL